MGRSTLSTAYFEIARMLDAAAGWLLGDVAVDVARRNVPLQWPALDDYLGGGLPRGGLVELSGPPGAGKSALGLDLAKAAGRQGGAAILDVEHGLVASAAMLREATGVVIASPSLPGEAEAMISVLLEGRAVELVVVDSLAALLPPDDELDPRAWLKRTLVEWRRLARASNACIVLINQQRERADDGRRYTPGGAILDELGAIRLVIDENAPGRARLATFPGALGPVGSVELELRRRAQP